MFSGFVATMMAVVTWVATLQGMHEERATSGGAVVSGRDLCAVPLASCLPVLRPGEMAGPVGEKPFLTPRCYPRLLSTVR